MKNTQKSFLEEPTTWNPNGYPHYPDKEYTPLYSVDFEAILADPFWSQELSWLYTTMPPIDDLPYIEEDLHIMCYHLGKILNRNKEKYDRV